MRQSSELPKPDSLPFQAQKPDSLHCRLSRHPARRRTSGVAQPDCYWPQSGPSRAGESLRLNAGTGPAPPDQPGPPLVQKFDDERRPHRAGADSAPLPRFKTGRRLPAPETRYCCRLSENRFTTMTPAMIIPIPISAGRSRRWPNHSHATAAINTMPRPDHIA